jgi:hypothetical protein
MDKIKRMSKPISQPEDYSKWIGLLAAGTAFGVGLFALREIKNTKKELLNMKSNDTLEKKMENLEEQLKSINEFIKGNVPVPKPIQRNIPVVKIKKEKINPVPIETEKIVIVNENFNPDEYEEVEVTDSDEE